MQERKTVVIHEEDFSALTLMKPFSDGYREFLIVVHEDAYGEMTAKITHKADLKKRLNLSDEEFNEMVDNL